jgi:hypothetical protein
LLKIGPGQRSLLPSGFSSGVTNKPLDVGSSAARRQQCQSAEIGMLV